ncbi:MFS transporter [Streptomyces sp. ML-6]|uniref:MFS transporter n=1 Tax=Streptomyces sp. ML-6 TaxID=2982693 RepID=UPI0024BFEB6B|nr:MFS transporter [Streptomyces sp. ML-6]MDK0517538.1 MFS transporter [Streptomyces sp. ML-6]
MFTRYATLFRHPGATPMTTAGVLARMPLSMVGIGIITMVSRTHGSYALAGALAACYTLVAAVASPQVARLVDRYGQGRVVVPVALFGTAWIWAMAAASASDGPEVLLFVFALLAGVTPSAPALVRSRWSHILRDTDDIHTAYSWETVLDELCFILGPPLSIGLGIALFPQAGLVAASIFSLAGTLWLTAQRRTEPPITGTLPGEKLNGSGLLRVLSDPTVALVAVAMAAMGVIIGTVDVVSVAFAEAGGNTALASIVLSAYAAGSCLSGFVFGSRVITRPIDELLRAGLIATALTTVPMVFAGSIGALSATVLVAGVFFAPTMILSSRLIEKNVPQASLTEALTWATAGLSLGTAIGPAAAGPVIDGLGAGNGFWVAVVAGAVLLLPVVILRRAPA